MAASNHGPGVFCVDMNSDRIAGIWLGKRGGGRLGELPLAENAIQDGRVFERGQVTATLRQLMKELQVPRGAPTAIHLPAAFAEIHTLDPATFGVADTAAIPDALRFELGHRLSLDPGEEIYDSQPVGDVLLVVSAHREVVEERLWVIQDLELDAVLVDVDALGVFNCMDWSQGSSGVVVQIGSEFLTSLVVRDGVPAAFLSATGASVAGICRRAANETATLIPSIKALAAGESVKRDDGPAPELDPWLRVWAQQIASEVSIAKQLLVGPESAAGREEVELRFAGVPLRAPRLAAAIEEELGLPFAAVDPISPAGLVGKLSTDGAALRGLARRVELAQ